MHCWIKSIVLVLVVSCSVFAEEASKLATFKFEGTPIGMTLTQFLKQKPAAIYDADGSEPANGLKSYLLTQTAAADGAQCYFLDGRLYSINVIYNAERIDKMGGVEQVCKKLVSTFGKPSDAQQADEKVLVIWKDSKYDARFLFANKHAALLFKETSAVERLNERRAKNSSLGF